MADSSEVSVTTNGSIKIDDDLRNSTVTGALTKDTQPALVAVKVKVAEPGLTPVTVPALLMEAIDGLLLVQVPPTEGINEVWVPRQMVASPVRIWKVYH